MTNYIVLVTHSLPPTHECGIQRNPLQALYPLLTELCVLDNGGGDVAVGFNSLSHLWSTSSMQIALSL